jgi:hypothetical protein
VISPLALLMLAGATPRQDTSLQAPAAYALEATLDERAHVLHAHERIAYRSTAGIGLSTLYLQVYPNAFRDAATAYAREHARLPWALNPLDWIPWGSRRGFVTILGARVDGRAAAFTVQETVMRVPLARPLHRGEALTLEIAFDVHLPVLQQVMGYRGSNYAMSLWFPKLAIPDTTGWRGEGEPTDAEFYADCSSYDVRLTVPSDVVVAATGETAGTTDNGDGTTTRRWRGEHVRYFAWVADRRYRVRRFTWHDVSVEYLHVDRDRRSLERGVATVRAALAFYSARYGPYPHRTLVIAETPALGSGVGGVAYSQLIMLPADLRRSVFGSGLYDLSLTHEIAHQWWGMAVGIRNDEDDWLNEGLAEFAAQDLERFREARGERPRSRRGANGARRAEYLNQADFGFDRKILQPDSAFDVATREVAVYAKASFVLAMLQYLVGRDTLDAALRIYAGRYRYRTTRSADFIALVDSVAGRDLTWFFDEWLSGTATCDYGIHAVAVSRQPGGGYRSVITVRRRGGIVMPVALQATLQDGSVVRRVWDDAGGGAHERSHQIVIDAPARVRSVVVDPDERLLETARYNNYYPRRVHASFLPRLSESDAYDVVHLPFAFYDHGVELGVLVAGGRSPRVVPPTWAPAQHLAVAAVGYNVAAGTALLRLSYSSSLGLPGRRAFWSVSARRDRTEEAAAVSARALFGPHFYRAPFHIVSASLKHERYLTASPRFDQGAVNSIELGYDLRGLVTDFYPLHGGVVAVDVEAGWKGLGSDWAFLRAAGRAAFYHRVFGGTKVALNLLAGTVAGSAPRQELLALSREANFRAAPFDTIVGAHLTAVNGEIRVPLGTGTLLGVAGFVDLAKYWGPGAEAAAGLRSEVGVGLRLFDNTPVGVQLDVPFWTSAGLGPATLDFARVSLRVGRPFHGPGR